jgi:hypothetical protein
MKKIKFTYLLIFPMTMLLGCKKTEEIPKTKMDILTANVWKFNKVYSNSGGFTRRIFERGVTPPTLSGRNDLNKVRFTFFKDGTINSIDADGVKGSSVWKFMLNDTQISIGENGKESILPIVRLEIGHLDYTERDGNDVIQIEAIPE